jgi:glutamine synthetase
MEIYIEQYCLTIGLEARTVIEMAKTIIFPAAIRYQGELAATGANLKAVGDVFDTDTLDQSPAS